MKNYLNSIIIAVAIITAGFFLAKGYEDRGKVTDSVSVTGLGEKDFTSDLIVWGGSYSKKNLDLKLAYTELNKDQRAILKYMLSRGVKRDEIVFQAVDIQKEFYTEYDENGRERNSVFSGYNLTQNLTIQSKSVDLVEQISREVTELIDLGIEFNSLAPEYYYTQLASLKLKMIEAATADAKERAEKIAENAGSSLGKLKDAEMGVFQITGQNTSEDYSWGGSLNTSSKKKTANITIRLKYATN
ncbi:MAG: SIMPL domain-containing protein [Crocinitomicaceae bacterium]|nr:SIMPL domain-containing protein [Crocinitomicaceae bacterium]